jgi:hypothetical protein
MGLVLGFNTRQKAKYQHIVLIAIPLILSGFVHIWNAGGFPAIHPDEGTYMRRAMHVLTGLGPQDPSSRFDHAPETNSSYDHPFFGQMFLAAVFSIIGYPNSVDFDVTNRSSFEMLYGIPRVLMGILAIVDTLFLYNIANRRYGKTVAFIAAILFAVMPITWILRRIVLDSILMPFLLSSVLFAMYTKDTGHPARSYDHQKNINCKKKKIIVILLSGIFLGLAIFSKIPAFTFIPVVGYIVLANSNKSLKSLFIWLAPVILIPLLWPVYAVSGGQFNEWLDGILWQGTQRQGEGRTLLDTIEMFLRMDPALFFFGLIGLGYVAVKKDFILLGLALPYIILLYAVGWATHFHWTMVLPVFCISSALLISDLCRWIAGTVKTRKVLKQLSYTVIPAGLFLFGLVATVMLISTNISVAQYDAIGLSIYDLKKNSDISGGGDGSDGEVTVVSSPVYSWIFKYILNNKQVFSHVRDSSLPIQTDKVLLIADSTYNHIMSKGAEDIRQIELLERLQNNTNVIATFREFASPYDSKKYPYTSMREANIGGGEIIIQANY